MKEIQLTQGKVALVDDDLYEKLNQFKWFAHKGGNTYYVQRNSPKINGKQRTIFMHHEVIGRPPAGKISDHEDGNGCNNQRYNLRHATSRQNSQNLKNIKKTSKYPGVSWNKEVTKWAAMIQINGKLKCLGRFTDELAAFEAYKKAVEQLGERML